MGCLNTALTAVPWGKAFKAIKVGVEAFKIWRQLDRAYTAVKDAEEAARVAEDAARSERAMADAERAESAGGDAGEGLTCDAHSFTPTTPVRLANGSVKPISKLKPGDKVLATDPQTGVTSPEPVQKVIVTRDDRDFTILTLSVTAVRGPPSGHGASRKHESLTTTWHHPFWDAGRQRWVGAHDLTPGTRLRQPDGSIVAVVGVKNFHRSGVTYDLTVGKLHTYYVLAGDTPVLVHNATAAQKCDLTLGAGPSAREGVALENGDIEADGVRDLINESGNAHGCHTCDATTPGTRRILTVCPVPDDRAGSFRNSHKGRARRNGS